MGAYGADYGTTDGVKYHLSDYAEIVSAGKITTELLTSAYAKAQSAINAELFAVLAPPATITNTNKAAMDFLDNIADELATGEVLKYFMSDKKPNVTEYFKVFHDQPLEQLQKKIKNSPALFSASAVPGQAQMKNSMKDVDKVFTEGKSIDGIPVGDPGTMDKW